jgi:periplasmic divalent cation tolerance protein
VPCKSNNNAEGGKIKGQMKFSIVYSTTKGIAEARRIANSLIKERIAACINIFPIQSLYKWNGKLCNAKEYGMIIKTRQNLVQDAIKRIKSMHSYNVPCIISFSINKGNKEFLNWIAEEVK